ncbi:response regulator [Skermanella rosea]|uniref:response regulator n=1 Tax=Skermanella rosea TaxID=1817965 RepID=UPI0019340AF0|nr:response regulator [Skermanella rosea]UEM05694.1 response regulator [Skermanella rosea]
MERRHPDASAPEGWGGSPADFRAADFRANVLVLDDDAAVCQAFAFTLEDLGCSVLAVTGIREAFSLIASREFVPDLIIADQGLGEGMTGLEAVRLLRTRFGKQIPACIVTGDVLSDALRGVSAEDIGCLAKPIGSAELQALVAPGDMASCPSMRKELEIRTAWQR